MRKRNLSYAYKNVQISLGIHYTCCDSLMAPFLLLLPRLYEPRCEFVCLFGLRLYVPVNNFFSNVGTEPPLPGYYQYFWGGKCILLKPPCEETVLRGFRPGPTQTRLYSHRSHACRIEISDLGSRGIVLSV